MQEEVNKDVQQESPEQQASKEEKKYLKALATIEAVIGGPIKPVKVVDTDTTAKIVAELFKEEQEDLEKKTKEGLKELLKKHVKAESEIKAKEQELKTLQTQKRKEFVEAANGWLKNIDQNAVMQANYADALAVAFKKEGE